MTTQDDTAIFAFTIAGHLIGLHLPEVERVLPVAELLDPPQSSPGLAGFLNYRGTIVPVLNMRAIMGIQLRELCAGDRIVMIRAWDTTLGLVVDEALGVYESRPMQAFSADLESRNIGPAIEGFIQRDDKMIVIPNLQKFLSLRISDLAESLQGGPPLPGAGEP
jgi:purine-binding chemotaxis protein CheW